MRRAVGSPSPWRWPSSRGLVVLRCRVLLALLLLRLVLDEYGHPGLGTWNHSPTASVSVRDLGPHQHMGGEDGYLLVSGALRLLVVPVCALLGARLKLDLDAHKADRLQQQGVVRAHDAPQKGDHRTVSHHMLGLASFWYLSACV